MATAPTSRKLNLTRDQLSQFLTDQQQIRQFELLFSVVDELQVITGTDFEYQSDTAAATANEALAQLSALAQDTAVDQAVLNAKVQQALDAVANLARTLELIATAPVIENNNSVVTDYIDFNTTTPSPVAKVGRLHWNGGYTLNLEMTANVNQAIGESQYYYIKASAAISKGQLVMFDGSVGASGVLKGKPSTGVTNGQLIMGVAAEAIANNGFGLVSSFGLVRGFNTTGAPYGEVWADGDILYYNPSFAGGLTKTQPTAPTPHIVVAAVVNAATAGSGSVFVRVQAEPLVSQLSDVYAPTLANGDLLQYDGVQQRWENVPASTLPVGTATNLAGGAAGSVPYQSASSTTAMLPIGTALQVLKVNAGATAPQWVSGAALTEVDDTNVTLTLGGSPSTALLSATSLTLGWTGQLAATRGGTGFGSYAVGDILYANTTTSLAKLADVATGNALISGGVGVAPSWGKIGLTTHVSGTLPAANGGTGITSLGTGIATWLGTPSSANLAAVVIDETGSGALVFGTAPTISDLTISGTGGNIFSGSYTPTLTNTTNITSSTASTLYYTRVGNVVAVFGRVNITATATGNTLIGISLPIASALTTNGQVAGMGSLTSATVANNTFGRINADATNDRAQFQLNSTLTTDQTYAINFTYVVL